MGEALSLVQNHDVKVVEIIIDAVNR